MKVLMLSDAGSIHTRRWVTSLSQRGIEICLVSLLKADLSYYDSLPGVQVYSCNCEVQKNSAFSQRLSDKMLYLRGLKLIRQKIRQFRPDFVHAHYASSFGLLGALTGFHPYVLSVWGSDVYSYPRSGRIYKWLLQYTLHKSDCLLSTSQCMADETHRYTSKPIMITPFGVDMNRFAPCSSIEKPASFVVGNVKSLRPVYGIDLLIKAFARVVERNPQIDAQLLIAGTGPQESELKQLCHELGVMRQVNFLGYISNQDLPRYYSMFDVSVSLSRQESFGVVAVEAMSCGCPVITSDAEGFVEVVADGETGFRVPQENIDLAADAIQRFIDDPTLRGRMGKAGRERVAQYFNWEKNVDAMVEIYESIVH